MNWLFYFSSSNFKSLQQVVLSHEPSVRSVREKGEALLELVQDITLKDEIDKLQSDYKDLCGAGKVGENRNSIKMCAFYGGGVRKGSCLFFFF